MVPRVTSFAPQFLVDDLERSGRLAGYAGLPAVRGELLARLGRTHEARGELESAARLTGNERERAALLAKAAGLRPAVE